MKTNIDLQEKYLRQRIDHELSRLAGGVEAAHAALQQGQELDERLIANASDLGPLMARWNLIRDLRPYVEDTELFSVVALLVKTNGDGKRCVLAVPRRDNKNDLGLPGGKIDPGEEPEQAMKRELLEETGFVPRPNSTRIIFTRPDMSGARPAKNCRCFQVDGWYQVSDYIPEFTAVWVPFERLLESNCTFAEYNRMLFKELGWIAA